MGSRRVLLCLCVTLISGCAGRQAVPAQGEAPRTLAQIYHHSCGTAEGGAAGRVELLPEAGVVRPYWPIYEPPRIRKVWIPAHVSGHGRDAMVAGHWTFLMVDEPHWYIERPAGESTDGRAIVPVLPVKEP